MAKRLTCKRKSKDNWGDISYCLTRRKESKEFLPRFSSDRQEKSKNLHLKHGGKEHRSREIKNFMTYKKEETINFIRCNNKCTTLNNIIKTLKITTECWNKQFKRLFNWQTWSRESAKKGISYIGNWLIAISPVRIYSNKMRNWTTNSYWLKGKLWTCFPYQIKAFD